MKETLILKGKKVGVIEDYVYITYRFPFHFMIKFHGFGISLHVLNILKERQVKEIKVIYKSRGINDIEYSFSLNEYVDSELEFNNNGDVQKFVSVKGGTNKNDRLSTGVKTAGRGRKLLEAKGGAVQSQIPFRD